MHPSRSPSMPCPTAFQGVIVAEPTPNTENASRGILGGFRTCPVCKREFQAKRVEAVTCSSACRTRRSREARRVDLDLRVQAAEAALIAATQALAELRGYVMERLGSRDGA